MSTKYSVATAQKVKSWLHDGNEIALLDIREHGQYGESHLFYAIPLPYSLLEARAPALLPRQAIRTVIYDDGDAEVTTRAHQRLRAMGYTDVTVLEGGISAWQAAGFEVFKGVNVPSKTFGELVEHQLHTPSMTAKELYRRQQAGEKLIVLDGRPFEEFKKMSIPGAICCPNGELALRIGEFTTDADTTVVINCAGRTRSIIGAQTLVNFGLSNPVYALENGTQGWFLAGYELDHGKELRHSHRFPDDLAERREQAMLVAKRYGVPVISDKQAQARLDNADVSTYLLDVRTPEEFAAATLPGAQHAPGGQLIQANDQYLAVRQAELILFDDDGVRAPLVASWMRQLGFEACVLSAGTKSGVTAAARKKTALPTLERLSIPALAAAMQSQQMALIDLRSSAAYWKQHVKGSHWSIRSQIVALAKRLGKPVALLADKQTIAQAAAIDLREAGLPEPVLVNGSMADCANAGLPIDHVADPTASQGWIDYLFFVHDRHDGNKEASQRYLDWETGLLAQLDDLEKAAYRIDEQTNATKR